MVVETIVIKVALKKIRRIQELFQKKEYIKSEYNVLLHSLQCCVSFHCIAK